MRGAQLDVQRISRYDSLKSENQPILMEIPPSSSTTTSPSILQRWVLASRPRTLPAAVAPVLTGTAAAFYQGSFRVDLALAALLGGLLLQIGANLANDVFDYRRGTDNAGRLGPLRVTQAGLLSDRQVLAGMWIVFFAAAVCGLYIAINSGPAILIIGALAILAAIAYTGGPLPFGYYGLGELFVFLFFGLAAGMGSYYAQTGQFTWLSFWVSVPPGLLAVAILVVNNLRDIDTDRLAGKRTLAVLKGAAWSRSEYTVAVGLAYALTTLAWLGGAAPVWVLLTWLTLPMVQSLLRVIYKVRGRPLNAALAATGILDLVFSILLSAGLVISRLF